MIVQGILGGITAIAILAGIHSLTSDAAPALLVLLLEVDDLALQPNHVLLTIFLITQSAC